MLFASGHSGGFDKGGDPGMHGSEIEIAADTVVVAVVYTVDESLVAATPGVKATAGRTVSPARMAPGVFAAGLNSSSRSDSINRSSSSGPTYLLAPCGRSLPRPGGPEAIESIVGGVSEEERQSSKPFAGMRSARASLFM